MLLIVEVFVAAAAAVVVIENSENVLAAELIVSSELLELVAVELLLDVEELWGWLSCLETARFFCFLLAG